MENKGIYEIGDQIVHSNYGVGEVTGIVEKQLSGEATRYYRVSGKDATYYVPVETADSIRVRPLASGRKLREVFKTLGQKPVAMDDDYRKRRAYIKEVSISGRLQPMAELLRDLEGRRLTGRLTDAEKLAFEDVENRLIAEWAAALNIKLEVARGDLRQMFTSTNPEHLTAAP